MTRRLLLSYLGLAVLLLVVLEVPLAVLAQRFERQLATSQAERDANGLAALAIPNLAPSQTAALTALVDSYGSRTGGEIVVIDSADRVIASSSKEAAADGRTEWRALGERALQGQTSSRFTSDEGDPVAVAAVPINATDRALGAVILATPATLTQDRIHQIWLALGAVAVTAIVVAALAGVVLARSLSEPLGRLEAAAARLGQGDLAARATQEQGPPEIRSLALEFNRMAGRLDELVSAQQRFVADASHQLRSPLTALRLRIENLEATAGDTAAGDVAAIGGEVQRLTRLVDGLLTLGRAGQDQPERADVEVRMVITERCVAWSALAAERDIDLVQDPVAAEPYVHSLVPGDLDQIIDNLLANALEVSPDGGRIRVRFDSGNGRAEIHVEDDGPGMPPEDRRRAFDRFWQGAGRPSGHSGLGLAIVRQLAARNGLTVELHDAPGGGLDAVVSWASS